jgi:spermidine synthase
VRREPAFALLLLCFFLSGFAALVYQTAWTRQFEFVFGTSQLAIATVLAAYMGGLATGAAAASRLAGRIRRPVLAYGLLELGIAVSALAVPLGLTSATAVWVAAFGGRPEPPASAGFGHALFFLASSFAVLWIPTALMGATLPLLARHAVRRESEIGSRIGVLYAVNTIGAVLGTCAAGFVLLPRVGLANTIYAGVAANALVFCAAALLSRWVQPAPVEPPSTAPILGRAGRWILPLVAVSGAVSFGYEVLWSRLLGHLLGSSVTAFATMLASFLAGIALGSAVGARLASNPERAARGFAGAQVGAAALSLAAFGVLDRMPEWSRQLALRAGGQGLADAAVAAMTLLPAALCIGATFPLAVRILARHERDAAPASARVFAWNTAGAIVGALATGFFLIPALGFEWMLSVGVATNLALAVVVGRHQLGRWQRVAALAAAVSVCLVLLPPPRPWNLLRASPMGAGDSVSAIEYYGVGRTSTVLLAAQKGGWRLRSNGLPEAWIAPRGASPSGSTAHWLGAVTTLARPEARDLLVIGLGGGVVLESVPAQIDHIDVIELEDQVIRANRTIADRRLSDPLADPRVVLVSNDARGALILTDKRYDGIVSQPSHPWTAGASHLYTREFFELAREHLTPAGVFVQWMGPRIVDDELVRTLVGTLHSVFSHVRLYILGGGLVFLASEQPLDLESSAPTAIAGSPETYARLGAHGAEDVAAFLLLDESGVKKFSSGALLSTDDHNRVQIQSARFSRSAKGSFRPPFALDPLMGQTPDLDRVALVRRLVAQARVARARGVAQASGDPLERAAGLAWVAIAAGRDGVAREQIRAALEIDPNASEPRLARLVLERKSGATDLQALASQAAELGAAHAAVAAAWEAASRSDWAALRTLDPRLARVEPGDPLYRDAVHARVAWRLESGSESNAREAVALVDSLIPRGRINEDRLLRAGAAAAAGDARGAWVTLLDLAQRLRGQDDPAIATGALELMATLPDVEGLGRDRRRLERVFRRALR